MSSEDPRLPLNIISPKPLRSTLLEVSYHMHAWLGNKEKQKAQKKKGTPRQRASHLSEAGAAAAHDLALADQLGAELGAIEGEVDVKVHPVERALGRVHALKVLLQVLTGEVRGEGDDFLDACNDLLALFSLLA